jgi:hypothetical protein
MANEPFVGKEDRPDLTVNMEGKVGDLTVRELASILGVDPEQMAKTKDTAPTAGDKVPIKEIQKDSKDRKDTKDTKDHKEPKDHKDQKEQKDHKDPKDQKDQKDHKDPKEHKDQKDQKDPKEHKDIKDHKDHKEVAKEIKEPVDIQVNPAGLGSGSGAGNPSPLDELVKRISGLEQSLDELKKSRK